MTQNTVNFDKVLDRVGPFGHYQIYNLILIGLAGIPVGAYNLANVFLAGLPQFMCSRTANITTKRNDTDYYSLRQSSDIGNNALNKNAFDNENDPCEYYYVERANVLNSTHVYHTQEELPTCPKWEYDRSVYDKTIVTEWDLVCSSEWKIALAQSTYMLGFLVGAVCFGSISDTIGRKKAWFISLLLMIVSGTSAAFMPNYWAFILARTVSGIAGAGAFTSGFVLTMEVIGMEYRMKPGVFYQGWFAAGYMMLALVAYFIRDFRYLQLLLGLVPIVFIPYFWLLGESPRWLMAEGKMNAAAIEVKKAARMNKTEYPDDLMTHESKQLMETDSDSELNSHSGSVLDLVRTPNMRRKSLNTFFNWFVNSLVYYGLSMGTGDLIGGPYINLFLSGLMEFPGYAIAVLTLDRIGRRLPLAMLLLMGGLCCLSMAVIPAEYAIAMTTMSMLGKLAISGSFAVIYVYSAELSPTVVRNVGVGTGSMFARVGGLVSPFVAMLGQYWRPLPLLIFGGCSLAAAFLSLLLPETLNQCLPETLEDGEAFGKDAHKNIFQFSFSKKPTEEEPETAVEV